MAVVLAERRRSVSLWWWLARVEDGGMVVIRE